MALACPICAERNCEGTAVHPCPPCRALGVRARRAVRLARGVAARAGALLPEPWLVRSGPIVALTSEGAAALLEADARGAGKLDLVRAFLRQAAACPPLSLELLLVTQTPAPGEEEMFP